MFFIRTFKEASISLLTAFDRFTLGEEVKSSAFIQSEKEFKNANITRVDRGISSASSSSSSFNALFDSGIVKEVETLAVETPKRVTGIYEAAANARPSSNTILSSNTTPLEASDTPVTTASSSLLSFDYINNGLRIIGDGFSITAHGYAAPAFNAFGNDSTTVTDEYDVVEKTMSLNFSDTASSITVSDIGSESALNITVEEEVNSKTQSRYEDSNDNYDENYNDNYNDTLGVESSSTADEFTDNTEATNDNVIVSSTRNDSNDNENNSNLKKRIRDDVDYNDTVEESPTSSSSGVNDNAAINETSTSSNDNSTQSLDYNDEQSDSNQPKRSRSQRISGTTNEATSLIFPQEPIRLKRSRPNKPLVEGLKCGIVDCKVVYDGLLGVKFHWVGDKNQYLCNSCKTVNTNKKYRKEINGQ